MPYRLTSYKLRQIQKKKQRRRTIFVIIIIVLFICCLGGILFFSPLFRINGIAINSTHFVKMSDIFQKATEQFKNQKLFNLITVPANLILFTQADCQAIEDSFVALDSVECQKIYIAQMLKIEARERQKIGILCSDWVTKNYGNCLYFDQSGTVFALAEEDVGFDHSLIAMRDITNRIYRLGDKIISYDFSPVVKIKDILANHQLILNKIEIDDHDVVYFFENGFKLLISQEKLKETANILPRLLEIEFDLQKLEYLDLRFLPKMYYK